MSKKNIQYRVIPHDPDDPAISKMIQELKNSGVSILDEITAALKSLEDSEHASVLVLDEAERPSFIITQNTEFASSTLALKDRDLPPDEMTECCKKCDEDGTSGDNGCFVTEGLDCICIKTIEKDGGPIAKVLGPFIEEFDRDPR
jgi:hypothetical protein